MIDFPALMPRDLLYCQAVASEEALFNLLIQKPVDLVGFFETAAGDETWTELHLDFMGEIISWLTSQSFSNRLSSDLCKRIVRPMRIHHAILDRVIPKNIEVHLKDAVIPINSLLLSTVSDFFKEIILIECRDKETHILNLGASNEVFAPVYAFATTGTIPDLWKKEQTEVERVLRQALSWGVDDVAKACQTTLKKYIDIDNAIDLLIQAQKELWVYFKQECIDFINAKMTGFRLDSPFGDRLSFEFHDFTEATLQVFQRLQAWVTDVICRRGLSEDKHFSYVIRNCPRMKMLDISGSHSFSDYLNDIPKNLQGLSLAECSWLKQGSLKKIAEICPNIKELNLSSNYHLNIAIWGELIQFKQLQSLNLSRCHQIADDALTMILKACPGLSEIILDECRKIDDKGFFELAKLLLRINFLSLVHCSISDSALLEIAARCRTLRSLNLSRCDQLTEKSLKGLAKHAFRLQELDLRHCRVSEAFLKTITARHPHLKIYS